MRTWRSVTVKVYDSRQDYEYTEISLGKWIKL